MEVATYGIAQMNWWINKTGTDPEDGWKAQVQAGRWTDSFNWDLNGSYAGIYIHRDPCCELLKYPWI